MKRTVIALLMLSTLSTTAQSWQWGKRGGGLESVTNQVEPPQEQTYSLVSDSHKNIYGLSRVGAIELDIDGVVKSHYDDPSFYPSDYALFSFGCDGSYRWSKIIGGARNETVNPIQTDNQDNVYVSGQFLGCAFNSPYPHRIENDIIIPTNPQDCRTLFLAKYNDTGVMQWIKRPQPANVGELVGNTLSLGIQTDENGNSYWLVMLPPDIYENGSFVNTLPGGNFFILKYNALGNYLGNIYIDIHLTGGFNVEFYRNKYNGAFYIVSDKFGSSYTAVVAGNTITHANSVACFDNQGVYQWHRESTFDEQGYLSLYNLEFDAQNNIYFGGRIAGFSFGSFLGLTVPESIIPGFVMKTNPTATQVLWSSYNNKGTSPYGGVVLNGEELGFTSYCFGTDFTWGSQTLNASAPNQGQEVLLARFNKDTGACIGLTKIPGNIGFNDVGTSITADASGDYILGGAIGGTLNFNSGAITNTGSQSDFFVSKYAPQACSPLAVNEESILTPVLYPNPTNGLLHLDNSRGFIVSASVYNYLGQEVIRAVDCADNPTPVIELNGLPNAIYLVKLTGHNRTFSIKIIKQ